MKLTDFRTYLATKELLRYNPNNSFCTI